MRGRFRHCARLFRLDCRLGILQSLPAFVVLAFATLAVLWLAYLEEASIEVNTSAFTFGDNVALLLAGQPPYEFRPGVLFVPPLGWLFVFMLMLYSVLVYPMRDLAGFGGTCIVLCGSRRTWWISKALWVVLVICLNWAIMLGVVALWTAGHGQSFALDVQEQAMYFASISSDEMVASRVSSVPFLIPGLLATVALAELQLLFAFLASPAIGFVVTAGSLVLSSYLQAPVLLGNLLMFARYEGAVMGGVSTSASMFWVAAVAFAAIIFGFLRCSHWDLLVKEHHS